MDQETFQTSFKFDRSTLDLLESLQKEFRASSKAEVMRKAIALLALVREARQDGSEFAVVKGDDVQRVKIL